MFRLKYRYLFILLLAVYSYLNILYTIGTDFFDFEVSHVALFVVLGIIVFGTWELNRFCDILIEKFELAKRTRIHPLIILFLFSLVNVIISALVAEEILYLISDLRLHLNATHLKLLLAFGFRVNLFLACVNAIVFFMERLKKAQLEAESLKKMTVEAQFEALRSQINPHFLFNSFNVLSSLVYKDADTSAKFIAQLSNVYRYLLYNQEKKIVQLAEELQFLQSYLYLIAIRFGENIVLTQSVPDSANGYVAPAVLQMLIENAIKHNVVSRKNPLHIKIFIQDNYIVVWNNLQEKEVKEESTKVGLNNIEKRYRLLTDTPLKIVRTEDSFEVRLPLLNADES